MSQNEAKQKDNQPSKAAAPARPEPRAESKPAPQLDFAKLDLSIEKVEERISPSETNVFDK